ncbi:MAG TPA: AraC family transcriptional regulator [Paenibacillus sp.]|jgi:AraC-like DNA-binding protein
MKRNWFQRLLLSYLPVFIVIVFLFVFIGIVQLNDLSKKESIKSSRVYAENLMNSVDMSLRSIEMMTLETITRNEKITGFAGMESDSLFIIELSRLLQSMTTTNVFIDSTYIYRSGDGSVVTDKTKLPVEQFADSSFIEKHMNSKSPEGWSSPRIFRTTAIGEEKETVISLAKGVPLIGNRFTLLVVNVRLGAVQEFLDTYGNSTINQIEVVDGEGAYVFEQQDKESQVGTITLTSDYTGWTYYSTLKSEGLGNMVGYVTSDWFIFGFLGLLIAIGWIVYITRKSYKPIETMMSRIQKYNEEHKEHPIQAPTVDELSYIDSTLSSIMEVTEDYHHQYQENQAYRRTRLFLEIVEGTHAIDQADWETELRAMGIQDFGSAAVSMVEIDKYPEFISQYSRKDQGLFKYILKNVIQETLEKNGIHIWQEWITNHRLCVIYILEQQEFYTEERILGPSEQALNWMRDNLGLTVTFGLGRIVRDVHTISQSYESAIRSLDFKVALGGNRVIGHWEIDLLSHDDLFVYLQYVRTIAQNFRVGNEDWREQFTLLFDGLRSILLPRDELLGILNYMNYYFYREMMELPPEYQELWNQEFRAPWDESMERLETLDEIEHFYSESLSACAKKIGDIRKSKGNHGVIQKIKCYIEENFSNPDLSLSQISDQFLMNPSSVSTMFKEELGEKFVVYLCKVRMERAKDLLRSTPHPIQKISEEVGYLHQMSFIRAFKKMVGTTPGDYRKVHQ